MIDERALGEPLLQPLVQRAPGRLVLQHLGALVAEQELQLAELLRLEPGGGFEPAAEGEERHRRHRLKDVDLRHQGLEDHPHPLEGGDGGEQISGREVPGDLAELVQEQLEPELVDLVDDDEQRLVVLGRAGLRLLQIEEPVELQVAGVGQFHRIIPWKSRTTAGGPGSRPGLLPKEGRAPAAGRAGAPRHTE